MSGRLLDYLGVGLAANRPAAAGMPAKLATGGLALYFSTDTDVLDAFDDVAVAWVAVTGGGGGGVSDGDKGDIVVSASGATWMFDSSVVTAFAKTLLDDANAATARATLGLGNVDNTSDANKPVSTAQQTALDLKANLASPALSGTPSAPTASSATNSTQIATTAFVQTLVANLIASAPGALDTLDELAAALGDDANFAATVTTALAGKQPLDATLTALAGLAGGADKLAYFTGVDVLAQTDLTAFGRTLLALADYAALRAGLNVADGATAYTDENARDAIGTALQGTANRISVTPNDGSDIITLNLADNALNAAITAGWASSSALTANLKFRLQIPFACTILEWTLLADQSGSAVVDVWKDTYANAPPVVGDSITASAKPTLSAAAKATSSTLTGWTTSIADGDVLVFNLDSVSTITELTVQLKVRRT